MRSIAGAGRRTLSTERGRSMHRGCRRSQTAPVLGLNRNATGQGVVRPKRPAGPTRPAENKSGRNTPATAGCFRSRIAPERLSAVPMANHPPIGQNAAFIECSRHYGLVHKRPTFWEAFRRAHPGERGGQDPPQTPLSDGCKTVPYVPLLGQDAAPPRPRRRCQLHHPIRLPSPALRARSRAVVISGASGRVEIGDLHAANNFALYPPRPVA